jgi:RimJ/RimL family protein N-acetyltransferase
VDCSTFSGEAIRIETASLELRPFRIEDAAAAHVLSNEAQFRQWLPSQVYADEAAARCALQSLIEGYGLPADPRHAPFVLATDHKKDERLIGHVGLSPFGGEVEVGFAIAEAYQRRGLATEAVVAACHWAFARFELARIVAITAVSNLGSRAVLARAGFEHQEDRVGDFQATQQTVSVYRLSGPGASR